MGAINIFHARVVKFFLENQMIEQDLERRANNVLKKMQELAPQDTGNLAASLEIQTSIERGTKVIRIVSDDPQIKQILGGTQAPYNAVPPWGPDSLLGGWGSRHGFTTKKSMYRLARSIASHGTWPAGTSRNNADWVQESLREANRK